MSTGAPHKNLKSFIFAWLCITVYADHGEIWRESVHLHAIFGTGRGMSWYRSPKLCNVLSLLKLRF